MKINWTFKSQIPLLKPKWEINKKTMRTYHQPSAQLFPIRWPLSNPNLTKSIMTVHKVKHYRNSDTKTGNKDKFRTHRLGTISNELLGGP